jgi:hypothetical protein
MRKRIKYRRKKLMLVEGKRKKRGKGMEDDWRISGEIRGRQSP